MLLLVLSFLLVLEKYETFFDERHKSFAVKSFVFLENVFIDRFSHVVVKGALLVHGGAGVVAEVDANLDASVKMLVEPLAVVHNGDLMNFSPFALLVFETIEGSLLWDEKKVSELELDLHREVFDYGGVIDEVIIHVGVAVLGDGSDVEVHVGAKVLLKSCVLPHTWRLMRQAMGWSITCV